MLFSLLITVFILGVQHYASTRKYYQIGAIIPILYGIFAIWFKVYKAPNFKIWTLLIIELILLSIWAEGREVYKKRINKMKPKDKG